MDKENCSLVREPYLVKDQLFPQKFNTYSSKEKQTTSESMEALSVNQKGQDGMSQMGAESLLIIFFTPGKML